LAKNHYDKLLETIHTLTVVFVFIGAIILLSKNLIGQQQGIRRHGEHIDKKNCEAATVHKQIGE
jgi:hypothetical protein